MLKFSFKDDIISFLLWIDSVLLRIFSIIFRTFLKLTQVEIFEENAFDTLYENIYLLIGVVALFLLTYMLLKMMINPDEDKSGKQVKDMIIRFVISMGLIIVLPTLFGFLSDFQNAIIKYNVVPNVLLDTVTFQAVDENGNYVGDPQEVNFNEDPNLGAEYLYSQANQMVTTLISGFMYPLRQSDSSYEGEMAYKKFDNEIGYYRYYETYDENDPTQNKEWTAEVDTYYTGDKKFWWGVIGCAAGGGVLVTATVLTMGWGAVLGIGGGAALLSCLGGTIATNASVEKWSSLFNLKSFTWTGALISMSSGDFSVMSLFANEIVEGRMHYTPILSTIVIAILIYLMVGFCIDVVVRQAKLIFYQLLAPLCFLLSVNPKSKDLMGKWFQLVITCWLEVFVRIGLVCAIVLLVGRIDFDRLIDVFGHPILTSFIILGIVTFARQIPKILKDITGIDSGNMKLNLREKIAEGGGFVAGSIIAGGTKMLTRGVANTYKGVKKNFEYDENEQKYKLKAGKTGKDVASALLSGLGNTVTGTIRAQISSGYNARNARNLNDMTTSYNNAVTSTEAAQARTHRYIARHGGTVSGVTRGLYEDAIQGIKNYAGAQDEILAIVKAEDTYVAGFDDYEAIYGDSAYKALDAQADQLEARIAAEGENVETFAGSGVTLIQAYNQAKNELLKKRLESIRKNTNGAAYAVYNLARQVAEDPDMAVRIGASQDLIAKKDDFKLKTNPNGKIEVVHADGTVWDEEELMKLLEGASLEEVTQHIAKKGTEKFKTAGTEMYQSKKDVKSQRNDDRNSVAYKEAIKNQQSNDKK